MTDASGGGNGSSPLVKTAGLIIIGDEILKGQVLDTNSHYIAKELYTYGVKLSRIAVIGDGVEEIAKEVREFSSIFDYVLTTGGIGPTHDDMTYVGIANAFGRATTTNPDMANMIDAWLGHRGFQNDVIMKMAQMPVGAHLIFEPGAVGKSFPIVNVENVYIFPGIPQFLSKMFPRMKAIIGRSTGGFVSRTLYIARDELSITPHLNVAVDKFKDIAIFGSYPVIGNQYYSTRLTMEASTEMQVESAMEFLKDQLPENSVVNYDNEPLVKACDKVYAIAEDPNHPLHQPVRKAVEIIEKALEKYTVEKMCICFNGGKDCTTLLHLTHAVIQKKLPGVKVKLGALCIQHENPFPEMETFVSESTDRYHLKLWRVNGPIKCGLNAALKEHPEIQAVLMGTRRSDPCGPNLAHFQMTDAGWPQVVRVSPTLDWTYGQIWQFLRSLSLPYCTLYDQGFTSIGSQSNTVPNPALAYEEKGKKRFKPAYTLMDDSGERCGRQ